MADAAEKIRPEGNVDFLRQMSSEQTGLIKSPCSAPLRMERGGNNPVDCAETEVSETLRHEVGHGPGDGRFSPEFQRQHQASGAMPITGRCSDGGKAKIEASATGTTLAQPGAVSRRETAIPAGPLADPFHPGGASRAKIGRCVIEERRLTQPATRRRQTGDNPAD